MLYDLGVLNTLGQGECAIVLINHKAVGNGGQSSNACAVVGGGGDVD